MRAGEAFSLFFVQEILDNCEMIRERIGDNEMTHESYASSILYQDMLTMPMIRICEIVKLYHEDFESLCPDYDWKSVGAMRDKMAHPYGGFDYEFVWDAAQCDLDDLVEACSSILATCK